MITLISMRIASPLLILLSGSLLFGAEAADSASPSPELHALRAKRSELAWKKRRILLNNDGNELFEQEFVKRGEVSQEAFLAARTAPIAGSQVDTLFYNTNAAVGLFYQPIKGGSTMDKGFRDRGTLIPEYAAAQLNPLQMISDFCRQNGIEVFWSFRMNDTHDGNIEDYGSAPFDQNAFKKNHPEYLFGTYNSKNKIWSGVNYALPEVREYVLSIFAEICGNYDIDGIELDFFRHPAFFKTAVQKKPATPEELALMTELIRETRKLTEEAGLKRGKPILLAVKVPDSIEYAKAVGLDLDEWLKEGLVDILIPSGYFRLNSWEYSIGLGHRYGVPVYPSLEDSRMKGGLQGAERVALKLRIRSPLCFRGQAMEIWNEGADGVYLYNFLTLLPAKSPLLRELGDPETLRFLDKDYFANARGYYGVYSIPHEPYRNLESLSTLMPSSPVSVQPEGAEIIFPVADNFEAAGKAGERPSTRLRLYFNAPVHPGEVEIAINGQPQPLDTAEFADDCLSVDIAPESLKPGRNLLNIKAGPAAAADAKLTDLQLQVRYSKK